MTGSDRDLLAILRYANQLDHRHLDRHHVRDYLLRLTRSAPRPATGRSYDEQYAWLRDRTDPASSLEREFLECLYQRKLRLPDSLTSCISVHMLAITEEMMVVRVAVG